MRCTAFDAVSMVDATFPGFVIDVEVLEVIVEIDGTSAQVTSEECGVGGEDGRHIDFAFSAERKSNTCKPLVELRNHSSLFFVVDILQKNTYITLAVFFLAQVGMIEVQGLLGQSILSHVKQHPQCSS